MSEPLDKKQLQHHLQRAAEGDQSAWRAIIDAYNDRVFRLIFSKCHDSELGEEITQSTFCTVAAKIVHYQELGKFEPWLFRIAMNRMRDEMRRRKRQAVTVAPETLTGMAGGAEAELSPFANIEPSQLVRLRDALSELSEADRHIIHLRHFTELSFKQIAELLEQPLGTVLARHHRALKKLRGTLERPEDVPPDVSPETK